MKRKHQWWIGVSVALMAGIGAYSLNKSLAHKNPQPTPATTHVVAVNSEHQVHLDHSVWPLVAKPTQTVQPVTNEKPNHKPVVVTNPPGVYYQNRVVVVTYHDISLVNHSDYTITPALFGAQLDLLQKKHFNVITNAQFLRFMNGTGPVPPNAVLLTFDDGYQDMYTQALPILEQHHMTGVFFTIVGSADKLAETPVQPEGPPAGYMTWDQLAGLEQAGNAIESHTYASHYEVLVNGKPCPVFNTHIMVNGVMETTAEYEDRVRKDFLQAKQELEAHFGVPVTEFAWPYGYGNADSTPIAESVGYQYIFSTAPGVVTQSTWHVFIPRIDIGKPSITPAGGVQMILQIAGASNALRS